MILAVRGVIGVVMCCSIGLSLNDSEPMMLLNCLLSDSFLARNSRIDGENNWLGNKLCSAIFLFEFSYGFVCKHC